jgi:hypothetical protein
LHVYAIYDLNILQSIPTARDNPYSLPQKAYMGEPSYEFIPKPTYPHLLADLMMGQQTQLPKTRKCRKQIELQRL